MTADPGATAAIAGDLTARAATFSAGAGLPRGTGGAAGAAVVPVVVGIAAAVRDALVPFPVLVRTTAHGMTVLADLVLADAHVAAAAVVAVAVDSGLAPVVDVVVAVRSSRMAGGDVAGALAAR